MCPLHAVLCLFTHTFCETLESQWHNSDIIRVLCSLQKVTNRIIALSMYLRYALLIQLKQSLAIQAPTVFAFQISLPDQRRSLKYSALKQVTSCY